MKPILEVRGISKKFKIQHEQQSYLSLRDSFTNIFSKRSQTNEDFWALKDVSFDIYPGDSVGIIGRNGAGKSTLLKILSKITPPTTGKIISRGRIASLLEVGTGFHPELSGRENIYLNGSILGLRRVEINKQFDAIVDFSGVEKFLDTPLKHYSSGMQLRLAFAVAAHLEPEVLIIDEVLAVGDAEFQQKCMGKMNEVSNSGRTILFVSHNMSAVSSLCQKSIILKHGTVYKNGNSVEVISDYLKSMINSSALFTIANSNKDVFFSTIELNDALSEQKSIFDYNEVIRLSIKLGVNFFIKDIIIAVAVLDKSKKRVFTLQEPLSNFCSGGDTVSLKLNIQARFLMPGQYSFYFAMHIPFVEMKDLIEDTLSFEIIDTGSEFAKYDNFDFGPVFPPCKLELR